jgi:hypothetical protein
MSRLQSGKSIFVAVRKGCIARVSETFERVESLQDKQAGMSRWQRAPPRRRMMRCLNSFSLRPTPRDFLAIHLPPALRQRCDLDTLQLESASFIEESLRAWYSDVLWSLKTASGEGYIYVVIEHQSSPDAQMAFRLMRYAIAAMQRHLDGGHTRLPLVVPMLFYHGATTPYPWSLNWLDCFADPQLARSFISRPFRWWISR